MMRAIVLAAGTASRLKPTIGNKPKCLTALDGDTILDYQVKGLLRCAIEQILVVIGYQKDLIAHYISQRSYCHYIKIVSNELFSQTDNAYSLALALQLVDTERDAVLILDGDILFEYALLHKLAFSTYENVLVADNTKRMQAEDCKLLIEDGYVKHIGKAINGNAVYTSMIKLHGGFLEQFKKELGKPRARREWYSEPLDRVLREHPKALKVTYTDGALRCEIDTPSDLYLGREIYRVLTGNQHV